MRESVGGIWLMTIALVFLALYMIFIAFIVRYVFVVRQKNEIINQIEEMEGIEKESDIRKYVERDLGYKGTYKICFRKGTYGMAYRVILEVSFKLPFNQEIKIPVRGETRFVRPPRGKELLSKNGTVVVKANTGKCAL